MIQVPHHVMRKICLTSDPPTPTSAHRLTDEALLEEASTPKSVTEGGMQIGEPEPTQG